MYIYFGGPWVAGGLPNPCFIFCQQVGLVLDDHSDWRLVFQRILKDAEKWNLQSSSYTAKVSATLSVITTPCTVALPPTEN